MMKLIVLMSAALIIGYYVGRFPIWATWHGPVGAVLTVPLAIAVGIDPMLSLVGAGGLGSGFLVSRFAA